MAVDGIIAELNLIKVMVVAALTAAKKNGWEVADLPAFLGDPNFAGAMVAAVAGIKSAPSQLTNLSLMDDIELGKYLYGMVSEIIADLKEVKS